ncbi:MAG TPA: shikimate dehydrogenase, partial [Vicinamibacterales bacterium]|nr:shikimate dehydrogenase [Vicinamibacterales bacterium]
ELRLDLVDRPGVAGALEGRRTPVIVTCRPHWEGGRFSGSEEERRRILDSAIAQGAEYVDVEAAAGFAEDVIASRGGRGVIVSSHVFGDPPPDLVDRYNALRATGAEVAKLAIQVSTLKETLPLFDLAAKNTTGHVLIAMGNQGLPTRVLAARLHNRWTYVGDGIAPGQLPASRFIRDFRFRRIAADAALYAVVGNPVIHSRSPVMHNAGFAALGLKAVYLPLEARDVGDFVAFAREMRLGGVSITAPFKIGLMPHVDEIDPLAKQVGAINTITLRDGRWLGANTDVEGFLAPLARRISLEGARVSVIGAGGAARAVAVALASRRARITICARKADDARTIADLVGGSAGDFPPRRSSWDVLVNATPVGSEKTPGTPMGNVPLDGAIVFDLVYAPPDTELLRDARAAGCQTIGGIEMLIAQAERQFELWTGQRPPAGLFEAAAGRDEAAALADGPIR